MSYRVFLRAPSTSVLKKSEGQSFTWYTARSRDERIRTPQDALKEKSLETSFGAEDSILDGDTRDWILPPATLDAASQRISDMYKNVIFPLDDDQEREWEEYEGEIGSELKDETHDVPAEESLISWPPTNPELMRSRNSLSRSLVQAEADSREISEETSYAHTSTSSITAFPTFVINLHALTTLSELISKPVQPRWSRKVNLLVAILEVDGPDVVRIKRGPDAGRDVSVLRLVVGSDEGGVCKLTAWRETADTWGGVQEFQPDETTYEEEVKKGDIVYLENILASVPQSTAIGPGMENSEHQIALTASPNLSSHLHVCYRSLPTTPLDRRFRPDLRLATSDPGLRKVSNVVRWLESMTGLS